MNTNRSYADSWTRFLAWCENAERSPLPASPETITLWTTAMLASGLKVTTARIRLAGVAYFHKRAGFESPFSPQVLSILQGARRLRHEKPDQKRALKTDELWKISRTFDIGTVRGLRDRALVVLGFTGAFRRSEIADLDLADVIFDKKGLLISLRWSKTDQVGEGRIVSVFRGDCADTCPVKTLQAWLAKRGDQPGPLFLATTPQGRLTERRMKPENASDIVKRAVARIGLDAHQYAGHSLRSGYCTAAAENGATEFAIMEQTGHKTVAMVHRYVRSVTKFRVNPLKGKV